jgi:hypothetical protein
MNLEARQWVREPNSRTQIIDVDVHPLAPLHCGQVDKQE